MAKIVGINVEWGFGDSAKIVKTELNYVITEPCNYGSMGFPHHQDFMVWKVNDVNDATGIGEFNTLDLALEYMFFKERQERQESSNG